jgi:hypothetical protein
MSPQVCAAEFEICVSMTDLVDWSDDSSNTPQENSKLQAIFTALGGAIDVAPLYLAYFEDEYRAGRGNVHVYTFDSAPNSVVALDLYNDPADQLDLITLFVKCDKAASRHIGALVFEYFNSADIQASATQQSVSTRLRDAIDPSRFPRQRSESAHVQLQTWHCIKS